MKEYLTKKTDGTYTLTLGGGDIEVPEGATHAICYCDNNLTFYKDNFLLFANTNTNNNWNDSFTDRSGYPIVWQRHTQPEALPFIDNEPTFIGIDMAADENSDYTRRHLHYFKDVSDIDTMDVYEVLYRFGVTDPCLQHIVKKALCAGQRGHKDFETDLQNIRDTATRAIEINCKP